MSGQTPEQARRANIDRAFRIQAEVHRHGGTPEARLRAKCNWECMTRTSVVMEWGDPREWTEDV